ncbi:CapA family protein [Campylobacter sp. FMV-PI01]|uniref:CapA family protein n=2 Tax=Campylobacter portucalensis TaxID=2608384 RepID=A0A6L5WIK4_9BACT|nr:CapA family protein [Campylobacter portucalensis]
MFHSPQLKSAKYDKNYYDFSDSFSEIEKFLKSGDFVIGNFESSSNINRSFSGYPTFNTPPIVFKNLKDAGFDALSTANNHALDTSIKGIITTTNAIKNAGLISFGTGYEKSKIVEVKGIKIALFSYSYGYNGLENSLNAGEKELINFLDEKQIQNDINFAKENGADFIIIYPHWGAEYKSKASEFQKKLAKKMVEFGADIVIGNHPHVVQEILWHKSKDHIGFIAFSCGNFISNQRLETMQNIKTEQSVAFEIIISKNQNKTTISDIFFHPLWVNPVFEDGKKVVKVFLAKDILEKETSINFLAKDPKNRANQAYQMTKKALNF